MATRYDGKEVRGPRPGVYGWHSYCLRLRGLRPPPSVSDLLKAAGFGHRKAWPEGKREIFRLSDGEVMGKFDVFEASDWLKAIATPLAA